MNQQQNDLLILGVLVLLLVLSAIPATATFAMYAGFLLLFLVFMNAGTKPSGTVGSLQDFGQELMTQPGAVNPL